MTVNRSLLLKYGGLYLLSVLTIAILSSYPFTLSYVVASVSATLVVLASYQSFKSRVSQSTEPLNMQDSIDKIEDPFDLYSEEVVEEERELTKEEIKEIIKEEKAKQKGKIVSNIKHSRPFFSPYRIVAYAILILSFFYLLNNNLLDVFGFLLGVGVGTVGVGTTRLLIQK
jgi:hypothetical protein